MDKKQNRPVFLFQFKLGQKAAETARTSMMRLIQEPPRNVQHNGGSRKSAEVTTALKTKSAILGQRMLNSTNREPKSRQTCSGPCWRSRFYRSQFFESERNHYRREVLSANTRNPSESSSTTAVMGQQKRDHRSSRECQSTYRTTDAANVEWTGGSIVSHLLLIDSNGWYFDL